MVAVRRRLFVLVWLWTISQVGAGVLAFQANPPVVSALPACCRHVAAGQVCPMHRARSGHAAGSCRLTCALPDASAVCPVAGPVGILPAPSAPADRALTASLPPVAPSSTIARPRAPATPPPRA